MLTCRKLIVRLNEQNNDMRNPGNRIKNRLSLHVWDLKDKEIDYEIKWKLLESAPTYNPLIKKSVDFA